MSASFFNFPLKVIIILYRESVNRQFSIKNIQEPTRTRFSVTERNTVTT